MDKHSLSPSETECKLRILDLVRSSDFNDDNSVKHRKRSEDLRYFTTSWLFRQPFIKTFKKYKLKIMHGVRKEDDFDCIIAANGYVFALRLKTERRETPPKMAVGSSDSKLEQLVSDSIVRKVEQIWSEDDNDGLDYNYLNPLPEGEAEGDVFVPSV